MPGFGPQRSSQRKVKTMSTASQSQVVATVISVTGVAFARNADGAVRRLAAGDSILEGETVFTLAGGEVELAFADGHHATILASESYLIGPEAMVATSPDAGEAAITAAGEVGRVITALEEGGDILEGLEAPAAGGAGEDSGNDFVRLLRIVEPVTPVDYEYPLNAVGPIEAPEGDVIPEEGENGLPSAGEAEATVDDDGIGGNTAVGAGDWVDTNLDLDNDEATFSGVLPHDFGSDGPGEINLAAMNGLTAAVGTETVTFAWNDGTDTLTATVTGGDRNGTPLFDVEVNPATGEYTVTLLDNVLHESLDGLAGDDEENDASVVLTYNVVDGNGDVETGSLTINLDDDVPLADIDDGRGSVTVDETAGVDAEDDDTTDTTVSSLFSGLAGVSSDMEQYAQSASSLVNIGGISIGADEVAEEGATTVLSLAVNGGNGTDSGLETTGGTQIFLYKEGDLIVGRIGNEVGDGTDTANSSGTIAFAIAIGQDGNVSVAQYASVTNPTGGASHDETASLTGKVNAVVTVTDGDSDTATDSVAIGDQILFSDDGPTADITDTQGGVTIDESPSNQDNDTDDAAVAALFSGLTGVSGDMTEFAKSASSLVDTSGSATGEDEEGATTVLSLAVNGGNGTDSGLETTGGTQIFLYKEGDLIVGRIGNEVGDGTDTANSSGTIAFAIAIGQDGNVSVAQYASVTNPTAGDGSGGTYDETASLTGKVNAVVTVTDGDSDTATDSVAIGDQILFSDDGPTAVDETTQEIFEGFTTTTDALVGTVDVPASQNSSNFIYITTLNGLTGGDTMNVTWDTNTNINWELRAADGVTVVASGADNGSSLSTTLGNLLATGDYQLWIDATNKALTVTNVTFEHDVTSSLGGNVLANGDSFGEDEEGGMVSAIASNNVPANTDSTADGSGNYTVTGQYGTLTINQDGTYTYTAFADAVPDGDPDGKVTDSFTYTIMDGDGDTDTATLAFDVLDVPDVVPSAAFFTMNTSNTGGGGDTGFQQFKISITDGNVAALSQTVEVANEEGQQDFFVTMGGDVVFQNNTQYAVTLEHISGSAHLNFTDFSITDKFGNTVTLNAGGGSDNVTLTGDEGSSYDGVVYIVSVDGGGNTSVSTPVGYDINSVGGDDVLVLGTPTGQLDFSLDMDDLPIGTAMNDIDLFGNDGDAIDRISISGVGTQEDNTLTLSAQDVLDLVDNDDYNLWISGDAGDAVILSDAASWTQGATNVAGPDGNTYTAYTATIDATLVTLYVENEVTQPMP